MATLTLKKLKCFKQEDWTGDDDIQIVVHAPSRKVVWNKAMDTNQTRDLGNIKKEFSGSARIQLMEVDWPDGDDDLGSVTVKESDAAAVDVERVIAAIDHELKARCPYITRVFIEAESRVPRSADGGSDTVDEA